MNKLLKQSFFILTLGKLEPSILFLNKYLYNMYKYKITCFLHNRTILIKNTKKFHLYCPRCCWVSRQRGIKRNIDELNDGERSFVSIKKQKSQLFV